MERRRFTEGVRQELARAPVTSSAVATAELAALVRFAGSLTLLGGSKHNVGVEVETASGAVARRCFTLIQQTFGLRAELFVRAASGVRRDPAYGIRLADAAPGILRELAIVDDGGHLREEALPVHGDEARAYLRGAVLASGSISSPGRPPHLEVVAGRRWSAEHLAEVFAEVLGAPATVTTDERPRVVLKSGERIGEVLVVLGAPRAFLEWDERRLRRQLRADANRLANADNANVRRSIEAAMAQSRAVRRAVARIGWDGLDEELRGVALARMANPEATLTELGRLIDPPIGKSAVHRRLKRLEELSDEQLGPGRTGGSG